MPTQNHDSFTLCYVAWARMMCQGKGLSFLANKGIKHAQMNT